MKLAHFSISEFDSPDQKGSGRFMDEDFLRKLDRAREIAGIPFVITSGFRTPEHQNSLGRDGYAVSKKSAHLKGMAADIACDFSGDRFKMVSALMAVNLMRIGIASNFIHVDCDQSKPMQRIWLY